MDKIKSIFEKVKQKKDAAAIEVRCGVQDILADTRGESQNTSNVGGMVVSLVIVALVVGFATGFLQNTAFPWLQNKFKAISGS